MHSKCASLELFYVFYCDNSAVAHEAEATDLAEESDSCSALLCCLVVCRIRWRPLNIAPPLPVPEQ